MKLLFQTSFSRLLPWFLLFAAGAAWAQEDNFPPNGQLPVGWSTSPGANSGWIVASDQRNRGSFSLKSSPLPDDPNQPVKKSSAIQVGGVFSAGTVSFFYQVSSEINFDLFEFFIDGVAQQLFIENGVPQFSDSGARSWAQVSFPVTAGQHVFKWAYSKDESNADGSDAAWIDTVVLPAGTLQTNLAVTRTGLGSGTVVSNPGGISCGTNCSAYYANNASVTLTATASVGSTFTGWSGNCSGTSTTCTLTLSAAGNATANFNLIDDNFPPSGQIPAGWTMAPGSTSNWRAVANSTLDPAFRGGFSLKSGVVTHGQTSAIQFTATVGAGTIDFVYRVSSEAFYDFFAFYIDDFFQFSNAGEVPWTEVSIPVSAGTHVFKFVYFKDVDSTAGQDAAWIDSVVMPANTTRLLTVTGAGTGAGTVTSNPSGINCGGTCAAPFAGGSTVTLTATASSGSVFSGWSAACTGTGTCQVLMDVAKNVTATFTLAPTNSLLTVTKTGSGTGTVTSNPAGINCGGTCSANFSTGSTVTLTATNGAGSVFSGWSNGCTGTATCQILMDAAKTVTATFTIPASGGITLDVDGSSPGTKYDALTDGLIVARYLFGLTGTSLTTGALGSTATRTDPATVKAHLDSIRTSLDIDGNGQSDALTDGLLTLRYMFGLRGAALVANAIGTSATRTTAAAIEAYIQSLMP